MAAHARVKQARLPAREPDAVVQIGTRVRALREARALSLRDLAGRCGVSAPMLSQVERGETSPTLAVAARIAAGLELSLSQLLRLDETSSVVVVRADERRATKRGGHRSEALTPAGARASVTLHTLRAGARTGDSEDPPLHAAGSRELLYVQSGALLVEVDGESNALAAGDAISFDADLPHHIVNPGAGAAIFVAVLTAGLRTT